MIFDLYMIVLTAFAVFGMYSAAEMVFVAIISAGTPPSVTVMLYDDSEPVYEKLKILHNSVPNNCILMVGEDTGDVKICEDIKVCRVCEISEYVTDVLFTKRDG